LEIKSVSEQINLGSRTIGIGEPVLVVAEIGINHNGDIDLCRELITASAEAGCEVVKFQKRTVDVVYTAEELARPRESPFGATNEDLKRGLEFGSDVYDEIAKLCSSLGILWTASCWDEGSVDFLEQYGPAFHKVASASLTDDSLLRRYAETGRPIVLSTGMSSLEEIDHAVEILGTDSLVLLHCTSTYPTEYEELNLRAIGTLRDRYKDVPIGFSAHDRSTATSVAAVALGACVVERHITMDRTLWGSDQSASLEPQEIAQLVEDIRIVERSLGDGNKRVFDSEVPIREKLRRVG
jgi:N-acetylneuraminate synthase